ncbi:MAG: hypothetical protein HYX79_00530 [Chloroflexi bacterium]|nr:hypothetical protein [Chloroflexota bacterium]
MPEKTLRIIDVNLNRAGEGLRVLEDLARLMLDDSALTQRLKTIRHELIKSEWPLYKKLLEARNSPGDVGADMEVPGEKQQKELHELAVANARRVQEALRVLEELAKLPGSGLDHNKFRQARFELYDIERTLVSKLLRKDGK